MQERQTKPAFTPIGHTPLEVIRREEERAVTARSGHSVGADHRQRHTSERLGVAAVSERPQRALSEDAHKQRHAGNDREHRSKDGRSREDRSRERGSRRRGSSARHRDKDNVDRQRKRNDREYVQEGGEVESQAEARRQRERARARSRKGTGTQGNVGGNDLYDQYTAAGDEFAAAKRMDETANLRKTLNSGRGEVKRGAGGHDGAERLLGSDGREYMQDRSLGVILKEPESTYPMQYGGQDFSVLIHEKAQVGKGPKSGGGEARARSRGAINSLSRAEALRTGDDVRGLDC